MEGYRLDGLEFPEKGFETIRFRLVSLLIGEESMLDVSIMYVNHD
jgi:hypothetical protein